MQLARIPKATITRNAAVVDTLRTAHAKTLEVKEAFATGNARKAEMLPAMRSASEAAAQALAGLEQLGRQNILDDTFQRYAHHSVSQVTQALEMLERPGRLSGDAETIFARRIFDSEVVTRLGVEAGERSLATPRRHPIGESRSSSGSDGSDASEPSVTWVDGQRLDSLGNPVRGGDGSWSGPDGERFGPDGSAWDSGSSFTGPDGETFSGI